MNRTYSKKEQIGSFVFLIGICTAAILILFFVPLPRQIGLTFRNTLYVFPLLFLLALAEGTVSNIWIRTMLRGVLFASVLLPYSGIINSGLSDQYALGGVIPWSDAFTMQLNTQRFLYGGLMGQSAAIRPLSTVFYAVFLRIFRNNYFALHIVLCILIAVSLLSAAAAVRKVYGSCTGAVFFTILYYYIRQRLGTFMTEPYAFICAMLCCRFLLDGITDRKQPEILAGFLFLSIGMNARPAAMFLFPALGLWYFFIFLKNEPKRILWAGAALVLMLSGFAMNRLAQIMVYGNQPIPNRQAAEMVYGLCLGGKSWGDVVASPEMVALNHSDNIIKDVADLCAPIIKEHPENILTSLRTIFIDSLIRSPYYGAFSFVNGNPRRLETAARYGLMASWFLGFICLLRNRRNSRYSMLLAAAVGIILSELAAVPFTTNYLRLYAASMWVPACITGLFFQCLFEKITKQEAPEKLPYPRVTPEVLISDAAGILIFLCAAAGAVWMKSNPLPAPSLKTDFCPEGETTLLTSVDSGSFIYLTDKENLTAEHIPYFRLPYVRQHFHDTASQEMFPFTDAIEQPTAIIRGIDLEKSSDALIFSPLELVEAKTGFAQFCGHFIDPPVLRNDRFFIPTSVYFFEDL